MRLPRAPWWTYALIVCFAVFFVFEINLMLRPLRLELSIDYEKGVITDVSRGGPADRAGLHPGDRIVTFNGHPTAGASAASLVNMYRPGVPVVFEVEREGRRISVSATPQPAAALLNGVEPLPLFVTLVLAFYFGCGVFLLLSRPGDGLALALGTMYLIVADFGPPIFPDFGAAFSALPALLQGLLWIPLLIETSLLGFIGCWFSLNFPRAVLSRRWQYPILAATLVFAPLRVTSIYLVIYRGAPVASGLFYMVWPGSRIEMPLLAVAEASFLIFNYLHLADANEKRRLRLIFGSLLMLLAFSTTIFALPFLPAGSLRSLLLSLGTGIYPVIALAAAGLVTAYAVMHHRVFALPVILRRGLQYAFAARVFKMLVPAAVLMIAADLYSYFNIAAARLAEGHSYSLWTFLATDGSPSVVLIAIGLLAYLTRARVMAVLDRQFFRERYNAQQILREIAEEVRTAPSAQAASPSMVARIEAALHPEFVALMLREPAQKSYRCEAAAPAGVAVPALASDSKLMAAFRIFAKPLHTSPDSGWLKDQLPHQETEFLRQSHIELLVPVLLSADEREALLALGPKKSEEPYSGEDKELLLTIASSIALLLERTTVVTVTRAPSGLEECPQCGVCFDGGSGMCDRDGSQLTPSSVPRLLTSRYRLDRRLGKGGMGTVYSARDTSLDRQVALKLIRDDLVTSTEAAERFRREAKAAAAITHPNLVTIYDFAVDPNRRAFLTMELLSGSSLRQQLQSHGRMPREQVVAILRGVCAALAAAHQRGLVHRDLKPENIFLAQSTAGEIPKVLDFGLAKFLSSGADATTQGTLDTGAGVLMGTPQYMSPEQLQGAPVAASWDLWALAVMTYEMLTGTHPFAAGSVAALHHAIVNGKFTPIAQALPEAPASASEFCTASLSHDPGARPQTAEAFCQSAERALLRVQGRSA